MIVTTTFPNTKEIATLPIGSWLDGGGVFWGIRAHFPPPGLEEDFEFVGFHYADE